MKRSGPSIALRRQELEFAVKFPATLWAIFDDPTWAIRAVDELEDSSAPAIAEVLPDSGSFFNRLLRVAEAGELLGNTVQSQYYDAVNEGASLVAVDLIQPHEAVGVIMRKHGGHTMHWTEF